MHIYARQPTHAAQHSIVKRPSLWPLKDFTFMRPHQFPGKKMSLNFFWNCIWICLHFVRIFRKIAEWYKEIQEKNEFRIIQKNFQFSWKKEKNIFEIFMSGHLKWWKRAEKWFRKNVRMDVCVCVRVLGLRKIQTSSFKELLSRLNWNLFLMQLINGLRFYEVLNFLKNVCKDSICCKF